MTSLKLLKKCSIYNLLWDQTRLRRVLSWVMIVGTAVLSRSGRQVHPGQVWQDWVGLRLLHTKLTAHCQDSQRVSGALDSPPAFVASVLLSVLCVGLQVLGSQLALSHVQATQPRRSTRASSVSSLFALFVSCPYSLCCVASLLTCSFIWANKRTQHNFTWGLFLYI